MMTSSPGHEQERMGYRHAFLQLPLLTTPSNNGRDCRLFLDLRRFTVPSSWPVSDSELFKCIRTLQNLHKLTTNDFNVYNYWCKCVGGIWNHKSGQLIWLKLWPNNQHCDILILTVSQLCRNISWHLCSEHKQHILHTISHVNMATAIYIIISTCTPHSFHNNN